MNLLLIKEIAEKEGITIRSLASASDMSDVNLHRCIRENKIQAQDLEKIAKVLNVPISIFFDEKGHIVVNGNQNQVNNKVANQKNNNSKGSETVKLMQDILNEKNKMIEEKERIIQILMQQLEFCRKNVEK